jgi:hypothetical protein
MQQNKGRICRVDQAWSAALKEQKERDVRDDGTAIVPFVHTGEVDGAPETAQADASAPQIDGVEIPLRLISTALMIAARDDIRLYLNGVYVHVEGSDVRVVATDGHRLIVSTCPLVGSPPDWGKDGVIVPAAELAQCLPLLRKHGFEEHGGVRSFAARKMSTSNDDGSIILRHRKDQDNVYVQARSGFALFQLRRVDMDFPDYARVIAGNVVALTRDDCEPLRANAIDSKYLRSVGDVALKLGARAVHSFVGSEPGVAAFFTFDGKPDTLLIVMPMRGEDETVPVGVLKIAGPAAIKASLSAYRAHLTRTQKALAEWKHTGKGDESLKQLEIRAKRFEDQIARLKDAPKALPESIAA